MSDFTFQPVFGARRNRNPRVLSARFGDGYEQRLADGINTQPSIWDLTFTDNIANINSIESFLEGKGSVDSFTWTPHNFSEITVVCRSWSRNLDSPTTATISATFEQVFGE